MAQFVFQNASIYNGSYDHSGELNQCSLSINVDMKDLTTFSSSTKANASGLKDMDLSVNGLYDPADPGNEALLVSNIGGAGNPISIYPQGATLGNGGYAFNGIESKFSPAWHIGEVAAFSMSAKGASGIAPLNVISMNTPVATTGTANGTAYQSGVILSNELLYSVLHVFAAAGTGTPTLTVYLQSSATQGGSYTTRITHTAATNITSEIRSVAGPFTDTWWRVAWVISGTNPSFTFALGMGGQ